MATKSNWERYGPKNPPLLPPLPILSPDEVEHVVVHLAQQHRRPTPALRTAVVRA
jgi:hypothetical protein